MRTIVPYYLYFNKVVAGTFSLMFLTKFLKNHLCVLINDNENFI